MSKKILIPDARVRLTEETRNILKNHYWNVGSCIDSVSKVLFSYSTGIANNIPSLNARKAKMSKILSELKGLGPSELYEIE